MPVCARACDEQKPRESVAAASKRRVQEVIRTTVVRSEALLCIMGGGVQLSLGRKHPMKSVYGIG